jgi:TetR/AcrR family transcriptional regulator, lmrAB and yxaGH operons repressor
MAGDVRERMVQSAVVLLARHGYQGTSFSEVLTHSGAPRGSIYHHFPDGKDQLIGAAIELAGARAVALLDALEGASAAAIVDGFVAMWRVVLERSAFGAGCSVLAVTVSSDSADLLAAARDIFRAWSGRLAELFRAAGQDAATAAGSATLLIAATEGAVVLARAERSFAPLDTVGARLRETLGTPPAG